MRFFTSNRFSHKDTFLFCFVSQHRTTNNITYGVNIRYSSLQMIIHSDTSTFVSRNTNVLKTQFSRVCATTYSYQTVVAFEGYFFTFLVGGCNLDNITITRYITHLSRQAEFHANFLQAAHQFFTHRTVHSRNDAVCVFQDGYLST